MNLEQAIELVKLERDARKRSAEAALESAHADRDHNRRAMKRSMAQGHSDLAEALNVILEHLLVQSGAVCARENPDEKGICCREIGHIGPHETIQGWQWTKES